MQSPTLSPANRFAFVCPIMATEVEIRTCVLLREKVYSGHRVDGRRGCQACIRSSKCPAAEIVRRIAFGTTDMTEHCVSAERVVGKIPADVLERIAPIMVRDVDMNGFGVPSTEVALIHSSRDRIEAQIATAPRERASSRKTSVDQSRPARAQRPAKPIVMPETTSTTHIEKAAATGDLAAALNA